MFATTIDMDATPELVTTDKIMANKSTTQYLMYTYCDLMLNSKTVYSYTIDDAVALLSSVDDILNLN